jgi:hypothetical protein
MSRRSPLRSKKCSQEARAETGSRVQRQAGGGLRRTEQGTRQAEKVAEKGTPRRTASSPTCATAWRPCVRSTRRTGRGLRGGLQDASLPSGEEYDHAREGLYDQYDDKLLEMKAYIVEKVDQFLKYKGAEIYEQARRDILPTPGWPSTRSPSTGSWTSPQLPRRGGPVRRDHQQAGRGVPGHRRPEGQFKLIEVGTSGSTWKQEA